jgi:hypothetical protein
MEFLSIALTLEQKFVTTLSSSTLKTCVFQMTLIWILSTHCYFLPILFCSTTQLTECMDLKT